MRGGAAAALGVFASARTRSAEARPGIASHSAWLAESGAPAYGVGDAHVRAMSSRDACRWITPKLDDRSAFGLFADGDLSWLSRRAGAADTSSLTTTGGGASPTAAAAAPTSAVETLKKGRTSSAGASGSAPAAALWAAADAFASRRSISSFIFASRAGLSAARGRAPAGPRGDACAIALALLLLFGAIGRRATAGFAPGLGRCAAGVVPPGVFLAVGGRIPGEHCATFLPLLLRPPADRAEERAEPAERSEPPPPPVLGEARALEPPVEERAERPDASASPPPVGTGELLRRACPYPDDATFANDFRFAVGVPVREADDLGDGAGDPSFGDACPVAAALSAGVGDGVRARGLILP